MIGGSDDYATYKEAFAMATTNLIAKGTCSRADFEEMGGWLKSTFHEDQSVYFTIAADSPSRIRLYLTVTTGKVFR